jgi:hypothetical protein
MVIGWLALFISGKIHAIEPLQKGELAARTAQPVDSHQLDEVCRGKGCLTLDPGTGKNRGKPKALPGFRHGKDVPKVLGAQKTGHQLGAPLFSRNPGKSVGQIPYRIHADFFDGSQVGNNTIAGFATLFRVSVALAQMNSGVLPASMPLARKAASRYRKVRASGSISM